MKEKSGRSILVDRPLLLSNANISSTLAGNNFTSKLIIKMQAPKPIFSDNLLKMVGTKFFKEISADDAQKILEALKKHGDETLVDKWVSVNIIANSARSWANRPR